MSSRELRRLVTKPRPGLPTPLWLLVHGFPASSGRAVWSLSLTLILPLVFQGSFLALWETDPLVQT